MKYVLDSSAFINRIYEALEPDAELRTIPEVYEEVMSKYRFLLFGKYIRVHDPSSESVRIWLKKAA
jgi:rRNA maturation endonuclease Nob1